MVESLKFAIVQADLIWENIPANLQNFDELLTQVEANTDVIVLPEMFSTGFSMESERLAEDMDGSSVRWMKNKSKELNAALVGSLVISENGKRYNRMIFTTPNGEVSYYDKKYLFKMSGEHLAYSEGSEKVILDHKGWKICLMICYDLRFPEWSRNTENYDVLIYSANWPDTRADHWKTLLKARAIENQSYVLGINRVGKDGNGLKYAGDTSAYDFNGTLLNEIRMIQKVEHVVANKNDLLAYRKKLPFLNDQVLDEKL